MKTRKIIYIGSLIALLSIGLCGCGLSNEKILEKNQNTIKMISSVNIGDELEFGYYNNKMIKWVVIDKIEGAALIISKECLVERPYNDEPGSIDISSPLYHANEWANCSLRKWLNNDFLKNAFDNTSQEYIVDCNLTNFYEEGYSKSGGDNTTDKIFILSYSQCKNYLEKIDLSETESSYWMRNPSGTNGLYARIYSSFGDESLKIYEVTGVRPVILITDKDIDAINLEEKAYEIKNHSSSNTSYGSSANKCYHCNGTGMVKYYYGGSSTEAFLNGHEDSWYGQCGSCGGTGRAK